MNYCDISNNAHKTSLSYLTHPSNNTYKNYKNNIVKPLGKYAIWAVGGRRSGSLEVNLNE